jgi:hypothetical protein
MRTVSVARLAFATATALGLVACGASQPHADSAKPAGQAEPQASAQASPSHQLEPAPPVSGATVFESGQQDAARVPPIDRRDPKGWLARKKTYYADADGFPQIIQGDAYPTIAAIAAWYEAIAGSSKREPWGEDERFEGITTGRGTIVRSRQRSAEIELNGDGVVVNSRPHREEATRDFFSSLSRLLGDLETTFGPARVKGTRYTTSAYRDAAVIEFCYPPLVVAVSALSNGAGNPERLYVLDLIEQNDSLLWHE